MCSSKWNRIRSAKAEGFQLLTKWGDIPPFEGFGEGPVLLDRAVDLVLVLEVISHGGMEGGEREIIGAGDLLQWAAHPQVEEDDIGYADAGSGEAHSPSPDFGLGFEMLGQERFHGLPMIIEICRPRRAACERIDL